MRRRYPYPHLCPPRGIRLCGLLFLFMLLVAQPVRASNCTTPVNMVSNGSFTNGLTGFDATGSWLFNQTLPSGIYGTIYATRTAVLNPSTAPGGSAGTNYPAASTNAFIINETDTAAGDSLVIAPPTGAFTGYTTGTRSGNNTVEIWFDLGWRQAGGSASNASTLSVTVNGTTYYTVTTINGTGAGNATGAVANGASLGSGSANSFANPGGAGALSSWYTVRLTIPYTATSLPTVRFVMSGGGSSSASADDFAIDRIYLPICATTAVVASKTSTVISDPVRGASNPLAIPGATLRYCIRATNPSTEADAEQIAISDTISSLPVTFVPGSIRIGGTVSGTMCNWNGSSGGAYAAGKVTGTISNLPAGQSRTLYFDVTLN